MSKWIRTPNGVSDIGIGDWCVLMADGDRGYCKARQGGNCIHYIINGHFYFDLEPVVAYMPFPELPEA